MIFVNFSNLTKSYAISMLLLGTLASCVTVPQTSVDASQLVGSRIVAIQTSHESFLTGYFDLSRQRVEDFLINSWLPEELNEIVNSTTLDALYNLEVLSKEEIKRFRSELLTLSVGENQTDNILEALNRSIGNAQKGEAIIFLAQEINSYIDRQRNEIINPINEKERLALQALRATYAELNQLQSSLTVFLQSLRGVSVQQEAILERLQLLEARDQVIREATSLNEQILDAINTSENVEAAVEDIRHILGVSN